LNAGAKQSDAFYNEQLVRGAGRFTNSIILPTSREAARVPTYMTNPKVDIFTQFLRYPTVFGNTILKNFARDTINNPAMNAPKVAAFVAMSTNVAKATNYWRTSEENRERIDSGEDSWKDTLKAYQRVGLLGPLEYGVRFTEALSYGQNPAIATANLGGPVINDIVGITLYNRGLLETGARKLPLIGTKNLMKKYTGFEPYTPIQEVAKEQDKKTRASFQSLAQAITKTKKDTEGFSERFEKMEGFRSEFVTGGLVSGPEVTDTKENPADRVDPFTGLPYSEQMGRLGFAKGGTKDTSGDYLRELQIVNPQLKTWSKDPFINKIIMVESSGDPRATSPVGAKGLMQIMEATAKQPGFGVKPFQGDDLFDPVENVRFGTDYMYALVDKLGSKRNAAVAYNWGYGNAKKWIEQGADLDKLPEETRNYIRKLKLD